MTMKSPMLASDAGDEPQTMPRLASGKIDGFRGVCYSGSIFTRSAKPISNDFVRGHIEAVNKYISLDGLDGELIVGDPTDPKVFQGTSGALRRKDGEPDFTFCVFDDFSNPELPFSSRLNEAAVRVESANKLSLMNGLQARFVLVEHVLINTHDAMDQYEKEQLELGYEGIMTRAVDGGYKFGRSTLKEGLLLKVKRFTHSEARIVGFEELMHNDNEAFTNELGKTSRSDHAENKRPSGMIGAYVCESDEFPGVTFNVSCGSMTHEEKRQRLQSFDQDKSEIVRFKWLKHGTKDRPRHALFDGFRAPEDV